MSRIVGTSLERLNTCHPDLREVAHAASEHMDFSVLCGARTEEEQERAFRQNNSRVRYPHSKHNVGEEAGRNLSDAFDIIPYFQTERSGSHYDWKDLIAFGRLAGVIMTIAEQKGIALRWGGDWDSDGRTADESFKDLGHFERVG